MRTVFITGARRGLGRALAARFHAAGDNVFATARAAPAPEGPLRASPRFYPHALDIADFEACAATVRRCHEIFGGVDVLINNASAFTGGKVVAELTRAEIDEEIAVTLRGAVYLTGLVAEHLKNKGSGHLVFISSTAGLANEPGCALASVYAAAKAAVIRFAECVREEVSRYGVGCHVIIPCSIREAGPAAQNAVSVEDVVNVVQGAVRRGDNRTIGHVVLRPAFDAGP
jgi:NAD(P)-dependent dehydrogenase (short-subunit alcohol dehydrogenase family)